MDLSRRNAWVVAAFAAALDLAALVCAWGFVSLLTDAEVIASPDAGRLVGPAAAGASVLAVLFTLAHTLRRPERQWPSVLFSALWSWVALVVVATVGYAIATGTLLAALLFGPLEGVPPAARRVLCLLKGARCGGSYVFGAIYSVWRAFVAAPPARNLVKTTRLATGEHCGSR